MPSLQDGGDWTGPFPPGFTRGYFHSLPLGARCVSRGYRRIPPCPHRMRKGWGTWPLGILVSHPFRSPRRQREMDGARNSDMELQEANLFAGGEIGGVDRIAGLL